MPEELNFKNRTLFHGDNLNFLRTMNSESVDLIATDPPFNKGRDFHATPTSLSAGASFQDRWSWKRDVHEDWLDEIADDWPDIMRVIENSRHTYGDDMGAYLCFMAVRLISMRRILKPTGSIYLHCDPTASHYLKTLMDATFGKGNFRNEIIWFYSDTPGRPKSDFSRKHDIILRYARGSAWTFNGDAVKVDIKEESKARYNYPRKLGGKEYTSGDKSGKIPEDVWKIAAVKKNSSESCGWPTQKPLVLYERIIKASSNEGDFVLDPFCGCATTLVAAERLNRKWVGIDIWKEAHEIVTDRLQKEFLSAPDGAKSTMFDKGIITFTSKVPKRTNGNGADAPPMVTVESVDEPPDQFKTRAQKLEFLVTQNGMKCQGCDREFDDVRYLELDHNTPRSNGGMNHIRNRILLCGPCNRLKSDKYTLSGLRKENKKRGYMAT